MDLISPVEGLAENGTVRIMLRNLTYQYPQREKNAPPALDQVSFAVHDGEYVAILGANGSGKSTLLKCINGLCAPEAGQVTVHDASASLDPGRPGDLYRIRQVVGTLLQNPDDQIVGTVVEEDVAYGPENQGLPPELVAQHLEQALKDTGLEGLRSRPPQFLSGGERQRLALAGVLAMDTPVLALDEAASMLDEGNRHALMDLLDGLWKQGRTILHITHNLEEASRAQRCIVLFRGRLVFNGSPQDLFVHPDLEQWGFRLNSALKTVRTLAQRYPGFRPVSLQAELMAASFATYLGSVDEQRGLSAPGSVSGAATEPSNQRSAQGAAPIASPLPAVQCRHLRHTYLAGTAFEAVGLEDLSLTVPSGTHLALIGPSGSGKSTLLRHLNAILLPTGGQVALFGQNTLDAAVDLRALRQRAVLAVQNPESAQFETFAADEVAYGPRNAGMSGGELLERVRHAMELVGLPYEAYRDRRTRQLSGGEKRRLALAGVLALDGDLFLLDEPTAALDGEGQERVMEFVRLLKQSGKTLVTSTHSMEEACAYDLVGVLREGRLAALGRPADIFIHQWNPRWNLRQPWTVRFCRELERQLKKPGLFPGETALTVETLVSVLDGTFITAPKREPAESSAGFLLDEPEIPEPRRRRKTTGIEFFRNVNLGQFIDTPSVLRNLGGGMKLAATAIILFTLIFVPSWTFALAVLGAILILGKTLGKVGPKHLLRGLIPAAPYILFMVLVQVLFPWPDDTSPVLWHYWFITLSLQKLYHVFLLISRLVALMALLALFSAVTPMVDSIKAAGKLLSPLAKLGIPVQDFILILGIALRFVPLLVEEAERIVVGQLSRGGGYQGRNKLRSGFALVVPLFLRALERSEVLAMAMELRLFSVKKGEEIR